MSQIGVSDHPRVVVAERNANAGGLSADIDFALQMVARYFDDAAAQQTAVIVRIGSYPSSAAVSCIRAIAVQSHPKDASKPT